MDNAGQTCAGITESFSYLIPKNPQKRRHSLWLPSPSNCLNTAVLGTVSNDIFHDKVLL